MDHSLIQAISFIINTDCEKFYDKEKFYYKVNSIYLWMYLDTAQAG